LAQPMRAQVAARTAIRRKARQARPVRAPVTPAPAAASNAPVFTQQPALNVAADANPYANPKSDYKADRLQSPKFTEPLINTPKTVTVLTKEILRDKEATSFKEITRSTAGVTLGTGEGGNAFGDRFFIRGFDARNDVFIDGIRDPAVSVRENFFTEQVEILRGPASSFAGRGTSGGAVNIVTKKATTAGDFYITEGLGSPSDQTKRVTLDVNKVISPVLAVRVNALEQGANVAGRNYVTDNRQGASGAVTFTPTSDLTFTGNYTFVNLTGLPDFGVPYDRFFRVGGVPVLINRPFTEGIVDRNTYYGFVNRDFQKVRQNFGTLTGEYRVNENITISSKFRQEHALLNYIGTLAESPAYNPVNPLLSTVNYNPQSRYQSTDVYANQTDATIKFDTGPVKHTAVTGLELSHERVSRDIYTGLSSEALPGGFNGAGSTTGFLFFPNNTLPFTSAPQILGNPTIIPVDTKAGYLIETANWKDFIILNGGVRVDDYTISATSRGFGPNAIGVTPAPATSAFNHSTMLNYNVGAVVKPLPIWSLYAAYATSSNPVGAELDGTTAQYGGLNAAAAIFSPERNKAIEVGTKWELFDKRLLVTGALFQTTKENAREILGTGAAAQVVAGAAYQVRGIDLEVAGKITDRWSMLGGLVLMDDHVTKSAFPTNVGLPLSNIANRSFTLLTKYDLLDWFTVGGQAIYRSQLYGGTFLAANGGTAFNAAGLPAPTAANPYINVPTVLPSYWRFDAFAEAKIGPNFNLKVGAINIFNRTYYDAFYQSAAPFALVAPGRSVYLEARAKF